MPARLLIAAGLALAPLAPAVAETIFDTHTDISGPSGKTPVKLYRPIARDACSVGYQPRQTGKIPLLPAATRDRERCALQVAGREPAAPVPPL